MFNLSRLAILYMLLIVLLDYPAVTHVYARWATPEDVSTEIEFYNRSIDIHRNGTYAETIELQTRPTKEDGGESLATQPLYYDASRSQLEILKAKTVYQGTEFPIHSDLIEDKPIASTPMGLTSLNQVLIKFPHVKKDAHLYLKYRITVKKVIVEEFFATDFIYGHSGLWKASHVHVKSEIPFLLHSNDPQNVLTITQQNAPQAYEMDIQLKKPVLLEVTDEALSSLDLKIYPWVSITTAKSWSELAGKMAPTYEKIANQPLPALFQSIADHAATQTTFAAQLNTITAELADQIKYMGDWRSAFNQWFPRDLAQIADTGQGDCKDYTIATVAILRKMGIPAHVAAVLRQEEKRDEPSDSPSLFKFNHVIVRTQQNDQVIWIDPTNFVSFATGLFPDIADRWALVFNPQKPDRERIPALTPKDSQLNIRETDTFLQGHQITKTGEIELKGAAAIGVTGSELRASTESIKHSLVNMIANMNRLVAWNIDMPDLNSRNVKDLIFRYQITERFSDLKTDLGPAYELPASQYAEMLLTRTLDRASDLHLGTPAMRKRSILLKNISRVKKQLKGCQLQSPWVNLSRTIEDIPNQGVKITDQILLKRGLITNQELQSTFFQKFQREIENCFDNVAIIYQKHTQ